MTDLERQFEEIRTRRLASTKQFISDQMLADVDTLLAYISQLRRPSDAKEIAQIQERKFNLSMPACYARQALEDCQTLLHALAESQRDNARLTARESQQDVEMARIGCELEESQRECARLHKFFGEWRQTSDSPKAGG